MKASFIAAALIFGLTFPSIGRAAELEPAEIAYERGLPTTVRGISSDGHRNT